MTVGSDGSSVEDLVRRAQAGSSDAFGELVERHTSVVLNFLRRRVPNAEDAEEIAQDTFLRAWRKIDLYDARWSFSTWLCTLARRLAATRRRASGSPAALLGGGPAEGPEMLAGVAASSDPARELSSTEERANLWSIADRILGEDARSALWLRYAEDLAIPDIAVILGRSSVSVRVMLFRARARLGEHLAPPRREAPPAKLVVERPWREAES